MFMRISDLKAHLLSYDNAKGVRRKILGDQEDIAKLRTMLPREDTVDRDLHYKEFLELSEIVRNNKPRNGKATDRIFASISKIRDSHIRLIKTTIGETPFQLLPGTLQVEGGIDCLLAFAKFVSSEHQYLGKNIRLMPGMQDLVSAQHDSRSSALSAQAQMSNNIEYSQRGCKRMCEFILTLPTDMQTLGTLKYFCSNPSAIYLFDAIPEKLRTLENLTGLINFARCVFDDYERSPRMSQEPNLCYVLNYDIADLIRKISKQSSFTQELLTQMIEMKFNELYLLLGQLRTLANVESQPVHAVSAHVAGSLFSPVSSQNDNGSGAVVSVDKPYSSSTFSAN